ncbi:MAG: hypothetical protein IPL27_27095 [Lewinellaceae bacterium]|nr:hypothetical protein [Lewinellaceae bacterium]
METTAMPFFRSIALANRPHSRSGAAANQLLQPGTDIQVDFAPCAYLSTDGNGNGSGRISMPGFPGGVSLPI